MDNYREEIVVRRSRGIYQALYVCCWVLIVFFGLFALMLLQGTVLAGQFDILGIVLLVLSGGIAVLLFLKKDLLRKEYEYTFTNGELDFAMVLGNNKRKELGSMQVKNVEACGHVSHQSFQRYLSMPGLRKDNWFLNRDGNLFYFYFQKEGKKRMIIIEPTEEMVKMIRTYLGHGTFQG